MRVFPFHKTCLKILAWVLTGSPDLEQLDKDRLYNALFAHPHISCALDLDYDGPRRDQFWTCARGEEILVADPLPTPPKSEQVSGALRDFLLFQRSGGGGGGGGKDLELDLGARVRSDLFASLPPELLRAVLELLPPKRLAALAAASYVVYCALHDDWGFWKLVSNLLVFIFFYIAAG